MALGIALSTTFIAIWSVGMWSNVESFTDLLLLNAVVQVVLFTAVACIPYLRTGRVSYVDIAWPFGVALIGVQLLLLGDADFARRAAVGAVYLFIGLRMGLGALAMAKTTGVIFESEFPRYQYRRLLMEQTGVKHERAHMLAEIMAQGLANTSVLAIPGFLIATTHSGTVSGWEIAGGCIWAAAYVIESIADAQKMLFISRNKHGVCNIGLWRYSRHPNYFGEWLVWSGLVVAAVPAWLALRGVESWPVWSVLGVGGVGASLAMYVTLVYITGATPAEYFSVRKREGYRAYQERTNMFFPWFPKNAD